MSIMPAILAIGVLSLLWSFYRLQKNPGVDFNMLDLMMENGRVSKVSSVVMGAFCLHSWIMLDLELHSKMTEGYLTIYGATWVAPLLLKLYNAGQTDPAPTTTTATAAVVTTVTEPQSPRTKRKTS